MPPEYYKPSLRAGLIRKVEDWMQRNPHDYASIPDFIEDAIRRRLEELDREGPPLKPGPKPWTRSPPRDEPADEPAPKEPRRGR